MGDSCYKFDADRFIGAAYMVALWLQLIASCLIAGISMILAGWRGRSQKQWFWIGLFFGPLALLALLLMPRIENQEVSQEMRVPEGAMWYYVDKAERVAKGPVSSAELQAMIASGILDASSWVWSKGQSEWGLLKNIAKYSTPAARR